MGAFFGNSAAIVGNGGSIPENGESTPGNGRIIPGNGESSPGMAGVFPGMVRVVPGMAGVFPGMAGAFPGLAGILPGLVAVFPALAAQIPQFYYLVGMKQVYQLAAAVIYIILFFLLFPWFRYVIDIDAISYIHVAQRFARGEYFYSVNAYWSPLISWLLVPFIKMGYDPVLSAKYLNGFLGLLTLYSCYSLINKFTINETIKKILPFALVIILLSYCFNELCADLLQLFMLTVYLNLIFSKNFIHNNYKIALAGLLAAICYFAKAYNFPFFLAQFIIVVFVFLKKENSPQLLSSLVKKVALGFIVFFLFVTPYIMALSAKYGSPRISNASALNISWILSPGISSNDSGKIVAAPPLSDAGSYWDEPFYAQEKFISPFTSFHYFIKEIKWTLANTAKYTGTLNEMSIFCISIMLSFFIYLLYKKKESNAAEWILFLSTILYQCGYLMVFIEWRYVWLLPVTLLIMAGILLSFLLEKDLISKKLLIISAVIISASFIYQPLNELKKLKGNNKDVFEMADAFKANNIKGNYFFLNYEDANLYQKTVAMCYLTGSKVYGIYKLDYYFDETLQSARANNIDYFLFYYQYASQKEMFLQSAYAKAGIKVFSDIYPGVIVVQLK